MAAWQVDFAIVPRRALAAVPDVRSSNPTDADWWTDRSLPSGYAQQIATIAAPASSGARDLQTWGQEDGNRIDVWSEKGRVARVTARVDVRRLDSKFGAMLLQFTRTADAVLIRSDGLVVEPLVGAFAAALRNSDAWRFSNDPAAYLASYSEQEDDE
jgi:hypothetical protein